MYDKVDGKSYTYFKIIPISNRIQIIKIRRKVVSNYIFYCKMLCDILVYPVEAVSASLNDIKFLNEFKKYEEIDKNISEIAVGKLINQLYYLTEECVALASFNESIDVNTKVMVVQNIREQTEIDKAKVHVQF